MILLAAAAVAVYLLSQQTAAAAPLSIYPEYAYTATPTMATTAQQKAATVIPPSSLYTTTQTQAQSAIYSQCAGAYPGCTPLMGDTQLGY